MNWECSNYSIIKISQNTEKSPGDLRKLAVTQTPVTSRQQMLVWKTLNRVKQSLKERKKWTNEWDFSKMRWKLTNQEIMRKQDKEEKVKRKKKRNKKLNKWV